MDKAKKQKLVKYLGRIASVMAVLMYISYIPQIMNNLSGHKGNPIQPLVAAINGVLWVTYELLLAEERDNAVLIANAPGIVFGLLTFVTAL